MSRAARIGFGLLGAVIAVLALDAIPIAQQGPAPVSLMSNPYRLVDDWPQMGSLKKGPAIGIVPDGKGGVWLLQRADPPILHIDTSGKVVKTFADGVFGTVHAFCQDRDGNLWAGDSGPFSADATPAALAKGFVIHKFTPDGKLLLTIGKPGVSKGGPDTFIAPAACVAAPNGDILIADGHSNRPPSSPQDGDRLVRYTKDGKFVREYGKQGTAPGEFYGPHTLAFDSQGRLFVGDRSNNRIQIFDTNMNYLDEWRHFSRPSGIWILKDDTLVVADSESSATGFWPSERGPMPLKPGQAMPRNAGWKTGIRVGSAKDGSLRHFIPGTQPEGMAADDLGNIYAGLTAACQPPGVPASAPGVAVRNCLQKWVRK